MSQIVVKQYALRYRFAPWVVQSFNNYFLFHDGNTSRPKIRSNRFEASYRPTCSDSFDYDNLRRFSTELNAHG